MIYIKKGEENTVVTDWYSTTNPVLLDIKIDGKFIDTIQPLYQNGTLTATLNLPNETEVGEWLLNWGDLNETRKIFSQVLLLRLFLQQ